MNDALAYTGVAIVSSEIIGLAPGNKGKSNLSKSFSEELDYDLGALTLGAGPAEDLDDARQRDLLVHLEGEALQGNEPHLGKKVSIYWIETFGRFTNGQVLQVTKARSIL